MNAGMDVKSVSLGSEVQVCDCGVLGVECGCVGVDVDESVRVGVDMDVGAGV